MQGCAQNEPYALQVTDSSMEPEFPMGCVVVTEPGGPLEHGCYVIAHHGDEMIFRQLLMESDQWRLHALEPGFEDMPVSGPADIHGRVIQRAGKRRKDRKSYL
jgi:DNA polymerase V